MIWPFKVQEIGSSQDEARSETRGCGLITLGRPGIAPAVQRGCLQVGTYGSDAAPGAGGAYPGAAGGAGPGAAPGGGGAAANAGTAGGAGAGAGAPGIMLTGSLDQEKTCKAMRAKDTSLNKSQKLRSCLIAITTN